MKTNEPTARFRSLTLATAFADRCLKPHLLLLGDDGLVWACTLAVAARLTAVGFQTACKENTMTDHEHTKDSDCTVDPETGCCGVVTCGVGHDGDPCPDCGGVAFHKPECPVILAAVA